MANTIDETIISLAQDGVQKSTDESGRSMENMRITDLLEAKRNAAADVAAGKKHFGLRFTKLVPPGTG